MNIASRYHTFSDPANIEHRVGPVAFFLIITVIYAVALSVAAATNVSLLKLASNGTAVVLFLMVLFFSLFLPKGMLNFGRTKSFIWPLTIYYAGLIISFIFNAKNTEISDALKLIMGPAFLVFGLIFQPSNGEKLWSDLKIRQLYWTLAVLPFVVWLWQLAIGVTDLGAGRDVGIFANRNNAALYAITLFALFNVLAGRPVNNVYIFLTISLAFGTLGVLVASLVAIMVSVARLKEIAILLSLIAIILGLYFLIPDFWIFKRFSPVFETVKYLLSGKLNLDRATYADLVRLLKTNDLSFAFRIKHWINLLEVYGSHTVWDGLFGYGIGSSVKMSAAQLVPHNDYLRYLFECGLLTFIGFLLTIGSIIVKCGRGWQVVPFVAVAIYFFSENLINNYLAMTIFYFCAGNVIGQYVKEGR